MKRTVVVLMILLLGYNYAQAQDSDPCKTVISKGMRLYESGQYAQAKAQFEAAKKIKCQNVQPWIDKCNAKLKSPQQSAPVGSITQKQIQCEQLLKDGKAAYQVGNYDAALIFFKKGLLEKCNNASFQDYIDICNLELGKKSVCEKYLDKGKELYDAGEYTAAKSSFTQGLANNCDDALFRQWITRCDSKIALQSKAEKTLPAMNYKELYRHISKNVYSNPTSSWDNGDKYKGEKQGGIRTGIGVYYWADKTIYFGGYLRNERSNTGIYIVPAGYQVPNCDNCAVYVGDFENDDKSGRGACYDITGKLIYRGDFEYDSPVGEYPTSGNDSFRFQIKTYADGTLYVGETKDEKPYGRGMYLLKDGGMSYGRTSEKGREFTTVSMDGTIVREADGN